MIDWTLLAPALITLAASAALVVFARSVRRFLNRAATSQ